MTNISNLPRDLVEEILSRVPVLSQRSVRSTCKKWDALSKDASFAKKHLDHQAKVAAKEKDFIVVMGDNRVYLMYLNLNKDLRLRSCIECEAKFTNLVDVTDYVFHCDGLLLCNTKDNPKLVVWNPYSRQTRWIEPMQHNYLYSYALGYEKRSKANKIFSISMHQLPFEYTIYDFNSNSWRVLDITPDQNIYYFYCGVSLKGNTYWSATSKEVVDRFLVCFDFTSERFGTRLPLPTIPGKIVTLSTVKEEQLAVLVQQRDTFMIEIWITAKIEPNAVSWNSKFFLAASMRFFIVGFFINEEKNVALVFGKVTNIFNYPNHSNVAYIVGVDGSSKEAHLGVPRYTYIYPSVCSYVPSLVQL